MLCNGLASGNVFGISIALYLSMILQDLTHVVDQADAWSERDQRDLTAFSLQHAGRLYPEDENRIATPFYAKDTLRIEKSSSSTSLPPILRTWE